MESAGRKQILDKIQEIREADFRSELRRQFPDADFAVSVFAEGMTFSRFLYLLDRILDQMMISLDGPDWDLFPNSFNWNALDGGGNPTVFQRFNELLSYFSQKDWHNCLLRLHWHIQYQKENGIWVSGVSSHPVTTEEEIKQRLSFLADMESRVQAMATGVESALDELKANSEQLKSFHEEKKGELSVIFQAVTTVNKQKDQIAQLSTQAAEIHGQMKAKAEEGMHLVDRLHEQEKEEKRKFDESHERLESLTKEVERKNDSAAASLLAAEDLRKEIEGHRNEINKLLGLAADGALGQWFDSRHHALRSGLKFWRWAVPITTLMVLCWAVAVFLWIGAKTGNPYLDLGINVLKTVPAFVFLAFVLRQYSRERLVEEEYAFRAAISKTIKTYTDMLEKTDTEDNKSRNEMLREVLRQIYAMPRLYSERRPSLLRIRSRDFPEVLKQLNEVAKGK